MLDVVDWCQICNSRPADGVLTVLPDDTDKTEEWKVCQLCVSEQPKDAWV